MRATATAGESTYAGIVRLVNAAQTAKAPFIRLADRYALLLLPVTLARRRRCLVFLGRSYPRPRRAGRGNALSADPGGASRLHRRRRAGGAARHPDQRRRSARGAGASPYGAVRQDRHADGRRRAAARRSRPRPTSMPTRCCGSGGLARAGLASCGRARRSWRRRWTRPAADDAGRRAGDRRVPASRALSTASA